MAKKSQKDQSKNQKAKNPSKSKSGTKTRSKETLEVIPGRSSKPTQKNKTEIFYNLGNKTGALLKTIKGYRPTKLMWLAVLILGLVLLATFKKNLFLAATVNGSPITNFELLTRLNDQYREQMLNQMVNEKLIYEEARKARVTVGENEVNKRISELETKVGGPQVLDSLLSQQGQTRASIKNQVRVELTIEKLYANEATVSAEEVSKYIEDNKDALSATDSASQQKEAEEALKQQKLVKTFNEKFQELKQQAKIQIF